MATAERTVGLSVPPEAALQMCVRALTVAGFKNISAMTGFVSAQKRAAGQWTKSQITLTIAADGTQKSRVNIISQATAQSVTALALSPSWRMVDQVARALGVAAEPAWALVEPHKSALVKGHQSALTCSECGSRNKPGRKSCFECSCDLSV